MRMTIKNADKLKEAHRLAINVRIHERLNKLKKLGFVNEKSERVKGWLQAELLFGGETQGFIAVPNYSVYCGYESDDLGAYPKFRTVDVMWFNDNQEMEIGIVLSDGIFDAMKYIDDLKNVPIIVVIEN